MTSNLDIFGKEAIQAIKDEAKICQHFKICLSDKQSFNFDISEQRMILRNIISPLLMASANNQLYNFEKDIDEIEERMGHLVNKKGDQYEFDLAQNVFDGFEFYWNAWGGIKQSTVIWECETTKIDLSSIFKKTFYPMMISNFWVFIPKSARSHLKKIAEKNDRIVFILPPNNGLESLFIYGSGELISKYIESSLLNCKLTEGCIKNWKLYLPSKPEHVTKKSKLGKNRPKVRLTGELPSEKILMKYPNWTFCLDEEGEDGQDETTIKPDENLSTINENTVSTAGEIIFKTGQKGTVFLSSMMDLNKGDIEFLDFISENKNESWHIDIYENEWDASEHFDITLTPGNVSFFPAKVKSLLPMDTNGRKISFTLFPDGKIE